MTALRKSVCVSPSSLAGGSEAFLMRHRVPPPTAPEIMEQRVNSMEWRGFCRREPELSFRDDRVYLDN